MVEVSREALLEALETYWGSREFRPLQQEVIEAVLAGRDAAVVMPTGGGKSLCYQMPALFLPGTAVVVSPLIALMKDQVEQLNRRGIPSAALNSATPYPEQRRILDQTRAGNVRLLYLAPERLLRDDTVELVRRIPVCYWAIDEAHCISEWGHEFRPDYRRLTELREWHPRAPIMALTASATQRVRHDMLAQLRMADAARFIRSFERKNLRYLARRTEGDLQWRLLEAALQAHSGSSVIVYASTIAVVEQTAEKLSGRGIPAAAYHAQMPAELRRSAQEQWMAGLPSVLVGTIAFGMGIDKPDVRAVIHLSLPKSIEQYYQEAGRAGRDGELSDCLLAWKGRDAGVLAHFIQQTADEVERRRAWERYHDIRNYAESAQCRHVAICRHFGQPARSRVCGMCDVCGAAPEWFVEAEEAQRPARARRRRDRRTAEPRFDAGPVTDPAPHARERRPRKAPAPESVVAGSEALFEKLRTWRLAIARRDQMPPYIVFHDSTLRAIASLRPAAPGALAAISGVGSRKVERYGAEVLQLVREETGG